MAALAKNTMAAPVEVMGRNPLPSMSLPYHTDISSNENTVHGGHKALPATPVSSPTRINDAPVSPVKISFQEDSQHPEASRALIDNGHGQIRQIRESERLQSGDFGREFSKPETADVPYRAVNTPLRSERAQAQNALISSEARSSSGSPPSTSNPRTHPAISVDTRHPDADEGIPKGQQPVPQLQYHHRPQFSSTSSLGRVPGAHFSNMSNDQLEMGQSTSRHLTPTVNSSRSTPIPRPKSAYSDMGPRGRSPGHLPGSPSWGGQRAPSAHAGRSHEARPMSYIDLANVSYPQAPPAPISMDNSQLRSVVGANASLLSVAKTIEMYRQNAKKLNDAETQYAFAMFLIQAAQEAGLNSAESEGGSRKPSPKAGSRNADTPYLDNGHSSPMELVNEAKHLLQKLSDRSYPFAQYYLADGYASGLFNKGKEDYGTAFPLFVSASKHGHAESGYRAALCYEFGWGCRKDAAKAVQFFRQSASKNHPGAMTRLGRACLSGDLGLNKYREGLKWLKRATESADLQYNAAPYHLALLYETGYGDDIFQDEVYAAQLLTQAADLGHAEAAYLLGNAYEHGKLSCPRDAALSVHFYTCAAQLNHPSAMMALCAWYMVGAAPVLEKDENEAYEWARQAADCGLTKAEYAVGYFTEMGIGCRRDPLEANVWYVKAAEAGDERAKHRLAAIRAAASGGIPMEVGPPRKGAKVKKGRSGNEKTTPKEEKECAVM